MATASVRKTAVREWWGRERKGLAIYLLVAVAVTTNIVMRQISGMLGRVEAGGLSNTMSVLTGFHVRADPIREAGTAWSGRTAEGLVQEVAQDVTAALITWHTLVDFLFIAAYAVLLGWLLMRLGRGRPTRPWGWGFLIGLVGFDVVENFLTLDFAGRIATDGDPGALATPLQVVTALKWLALVALLLDVAGLLLAAAETAPAASEKKLMTRLGNAVGAANLERRIWRRHRVQIGALVVLGVLVALPAGGPLDQIPDILRTYADTPDVRWAEYVWSFVTLGILCLALWVAGRWALLDGAVTRTRRAELDRDTGHDIPGATEATGAHEAEVQTEEAVEDRWAGPRPRVVFLAAVVLWIGTALLFFFEPDGFRFNGGIFALPLLLTVLWILWWPFGRTPERGTAEIASTDPGRGADYVLVHADGRQETVHTAGQDGAAEDQAQSEPVHVPAHDRESVRRAGRFLAALPIAIAGLGLVRAFVDPLIAYPFTGRQERESLILLSLAIFAVLVAAPLFYAALALTELLVLRDDGTPTSVKRAVQNVIGALVLAVAVVLSGLAAWDPITWGPRLNATGSVTTALAVVVLLGGALQWLAERQAPYAPFRRLRLRERTPFFVLLTLAFVLAGLLNVQGGYHALRVEEPSGTAAEELDLDTMFGDWLAQAAEACSVENGYAPTGGPSVPLVLVAAPGGGIRAAYWTDHALHQLREGTDCDGRVTFAASGVSGGSVGLMTHYLHVDDDPTDDELVKDMSREGALSASVAAMVFRDLPAAFLGVSAGWRDRGAVIEDAWAESGEVWDTTRLVRDLAPGPSDDGWRPLLLLNGAEVSTGCRVVVSPRQVVASGAEGAPRSCRSAAVADVGHGIVEGAVDLHWFRDEQACDDDSVDDGDLRASSAALLAARFPYVSPSAELFSCVDTDEDGDIDEDDDVRRAADLDGGVAENSGLATTLDLWEALEPLVATHNATVVRCREDEDVVGCADAAEEPVVVPMLVLVDNHYASSAVAAPVSRQRELSAPAGLLSAGGVLATQSVLEQEALVTFSGAAPGLEPRDDAPLRYFRVAPTVRPGLAAPLGWTLSDLTRRDLDGQLRTAMEQACTVQDDGMLLPAAPACYKAAVGGPSSSG